MKRACFDLHILIKKESPHKQCAVVKALTTENKWNCVFEQAKKNSKF